MPQLSVDSSWRNFLAYGLLRLVRPAVLDAFQEIEQVAQLSEGSALRWQEDRLVALLQHAARTVPYYRRVLDQAGVARNGKIDLSRFHQIPPLTKTIIRREQTKLLSFGSETQRAAWNTSGGSTGEPVRILQDRRYDDWNTATKLFYKYTAIQQCPGDPELRLWGSERDILQGQASFSARMRDWLYHRKDINTFRFSTADLQRFVQQWNAWKPRWVEAYVQSLYELAVYLQRTQQTIWAPLGLLTSAGTLYPSMQTRMEEVFAAPVFNRYGSREVGGVAFGRHHLAISFWNQYIEVLPTTSLETTDGNLLITNLHNYAMPLIRFDIGDMAETAGPLHLARVLGRRVSLFRNRHAQWIDGEFFTHLFYHRPWLERFQVVQHTEEHIEIKIVPQGNIPDDERQQIEDAIAQVMTPECRVEWRIVEIIPPLPSGKYTYTWSHLPPPSAQAPQT